MKLDAADPADPQIGGKARSLARLAAAGFSTPPGFAITNLEIYAGEGAFPAGFLDHLAHQLATLSCAAFSVRSSFTGEDDGNALAAGIYESRINVRAAQVPGAIAEVLRSAAGGAEIAYARAHGRAPVAPPLAVLVHEFIAGDASGAAAFDPESPPALIATRHGEPASTARKILIDALHALARREGAVEIEWVTRGNAPTFLQLRPYRAPQPSPPWPGLAELGDPREQAGWIWDAAHNPLPLSPAQQGLVALVDERCRTGTRQRVAGGYLFFASGGPPAPATIAPEDAPVFLQRLATDMDARLASLQAHPSLEDALATFVAFYEPLVGVAGPAIRRGKQALVEFVRVYAPGDLSRLPDLLAGVESLAQERRRRAHDTTRYLELFGDEAPVWDVAAATLRENPSWIAARGRNGIVPAASPALDWKPMSGSDWDHVLDTARACVAAGEYDDWLYARLAAPIRRALLGLGHRLCQAGYLDAAGDIFFLPLAQSRALAIGQPPACPLRPIASANRRAHEHAMRMPPPAPGAATASNRIRGTGTAGRAVGPVFLHRPALEGAPARPCPPGAVLVATTLLPTELPLIDAIALVVETGGLLDHVAAQARERGLPAIVGANGATTSLADGEPVLVDADRGLVVALRR